MHYRLVIFDFDGTLANSGPWITRVMDELGAEFHFDPLAPADYERLRKLHAREFLKHLGMPVWKYPLLMARIRQYARRDAAQIPLFPGVGALFQKLAEQNRSVAILSSNAEDTIRAVLGPALVARVTQFSCGASLFGKAAKMKSLLRKARVEAAQAIYVGDEIRDSLAAKKAGLSFGAVAWGFTCPDALAALPPEHFLKTVEEIALLP